MNSKHPPQTSSFTYGNQRKKNLFLKKKEKGGTTHCNTELILICSQPIETLNMKDENHVHHK